MALIGDSVTVEMLVSGAWVNITSDVRVSAIALRRGRTSETATADAQRCTLTLNNRHGAYSPRNPASPYYKRIGRNTQLRVKVGAAVRFVGEIASWPPRWDLSGNDVWVPLEASGPLRRLTQGSAPKDSALRRHIRTQSPVAYFPLEDEADAAAFASGIGGAPMRFFRGAPTPAVDAGFPGSGALPTFNEAGAKGPVPFATDTGNVVFGALFAIPATGMTEESTLLSATAAISGVSLYTQIKKITIKYVSAGVGGFRVQAYDADGAVLLDVTRTDWLTTVPGSRFLLNFQTVGDGSDTRWTLDYVPIVATDIIPSVQRHTGTLVGARFGAVSTVTAGDRGDLTGAPTIGHVVVSHDPAALSTVAMRRAIMAWNGETALSRVGRLCAEENVGTELVTDPEISSEWMGPQGVATFVELLRECEATDMGILAESRSALAIRYVERGALYSHRLGTYPPLSLVYTSGHISAPLESDDDDQNVVNDVTVTRDGGSSVRATLDTGALSTQAPPNGVGRYATAVPVSAHGDDQLPDLAWWRLHLGTVDEARWPSVRVDLVANPGLVTVATAADVGSWLRLTGLPSWLPPGAVELLILGYSETVTAERWDVIFNCAPAGPYRALELGASAYGRLDSLASTLAAAMTSTASSVAVASTRAPWTTTAVPFNIVVAGEEMTATAVTGATSPQTFTVVRSVNGIVKAQSAGAQVRLAIPVAIPL